jgi:hypothetical protein
MSNSTRFITGGVVGVVVGLGAAALINYIATGSAIGPPERVNVAIALAQDGNNCTPSDPDAVWAHGNRTVTWVITNNCNAAQTLQFRNFREKNPDGTLGANTVDLFGAGLPPATPSIPAGGQSVTVQYILNHSNGNPNRHIFKYEIWIGPTAATLQKGRDPDIETWD